MSGPLVSVIIPTHNGEKYLGEAIQSILNQDYRNYEIWVLDNGSTDRSREVAQAFSAVNYVYSDTANVALARRQGVALARGDYIAFLDQDDQWVPHKLTTQVHFLETQAQYGAVIGLQQMFLQEGYKKPHWLKQEYLDTPQFAYLPSTLLVRQSTFAITQNFDTTFPSASDVAWFFKAKHAGINVGVIQEVLLHRRIHDSNDSNRYSALQREILMVIKASLKDRREASDND